MQTHIVLGPDGRSPALATCQGCGKRLEYPAGWLTEGDLYRYVNRFLRQHRRACAPTPATLTKRS